MISKSLKQGKCHGLWRSFRWRPSFQMLTPLSFRHHGSYFGANTGSGTWIGSGTWTGSGFCTGSGSGSGSWTFSGSITGCQKLRNAFASMLKAASASSSRFRSLALWRDLNLVGCFARLHFFLIMSLELMIKRMQKRRLALKMKRIVSESEELTIEIEKRTLTHGILYDNFGI